MLELLIAAAALATGSICTVLAMEAHKKVLQRTMRQMEEQRLLELGNLTSDRDYYREQMTLLRTDQAVDDAYGSGYVEGIHQGASLGDVERMAYSLEQKHPERIVRMEQYRRSRKQEAHHG